MGKDIFLNNKPVKMKTVSGSDSGMMGLYGLEHIRNAKTVWLTEGPSDMLALDSCLPDEMRGEHVVITHSAGAMERPKDWQLSYFKNKNVIVLSDADNAGIEGAKKWGQAISTVTKNVKTVTLPYERTESHGKDVRDYLNEGHTFAELLELSKNATNIESEQSADCLLTELGEIDPDTGKVILSVNQTLPTAWAFIKQYYMHDNIPTLKYQNSIFFSWKNNAYRPIEENYLRKQIHYFLHEAVTQSVIRNKVYYNPFPAKDSTVTSALDAIKNVSFLYGDIPSHHWLGESPCPVDDPTMVIFGKTKNLDMKTMKTFDPSPLWFNYNALDFDYDSTKKSPVKWDKFMGELFEQDIESYQTLMQFIGLLLTPITKYQKALYIIGPKRSGKGTIAKIIQKLVGTSNCCSPTTTGLADRFGMETLIGKTVSIINDARFNKQTAQTAIERILNITGEDCISIERKFKTPITLRLPARMIFLSNELPYLPDSSNAITSRFILLKLTKSFFDNPNTNLENELAEELPEILNLAIFWFHKLIEEGRFVQPTSSLDDVELMYDLGSNINKFIKEKCKVEPEAWTENGVLWKAWADWCEEEGIYQGSRAVFFRNLNTAIPKIKLKLSKDKERKTFKYYEGVGLNDTF
jgi:putative DNA primase/helicase